MAQHDGILQSKFRLRSLEGVGAVYHKSLGCRKVAIGKVRNLDKRIIMKSRKE